MKAFTCFISLAIIFLSSTEGLDAAKTKYKPCGDIYKYQVVGALSNDFSTCSSKSGYNLENPTTLPTSKQRESICKCKGFLVGLQKIELPRCTIKVDNTDTSLKVFFGSVYSDCDLPEPKEAPLPLTNSASSSGSMGSEAPSPKPSLVLPVKTPKAKHSKAPSASLDGSQASTSGSSSDENEIEYLSTDESGSEETDDQSEESEPEENTPSPVPTVDSASSSIISSSALAFASTIAAFYLAL